tara:strand:+ start:96 stop:1604 length:1509 start_codon:yes stop_codon:yes gene_type:complete
MEMTDEEKAEAMALAAKRAAATRGAYLTRAPSEAELATAARVDRQYSADNAEQRYKDRHLDITSSSPLGAPIARLINNLGGRKKLISGYKEAIFGEQQALRQSALALKNREESRDADVANLGNERSLERTLAAQIHAESVLKEGRGYDAGVLKEGRDYAAGVLGEGRDYTAGLLADSQAREAEVLGEGRDYAAGLLADSQAREDKGLSEGRDYAAGLLADSNNREDEVLGESRDYAAGVLGEGRDYTAGVLGEGRDYTAGLLADSNQRADRAAKVPTMVYDGTGKSKMVRFSQDGTITDSAGNPTTLDPTVWSTKAPSVKRRPSVVKIREGRQARQLLDMLTEQRDNIRAFNSGVDSRIGTEDDKPLNRARDVPIRMMNKIPGFSAGAGALIEERFNNTPDDKKRRQLKSNAALITAELKHELYGASFTGNEGELSKEWAFDAPGISDATVLDRLENTIRKTQMKIDQDFGGLDYPEFDFFAPPPDEVEDEAILQLIIDRNL